MADIATAYNMAADQIAHLESVAQANNAFNARQASIQREWQEKQNAKAMAFNQDEAAKNRDWQELMSNTAHQREVKDLIAAGLNPVLSATGGNGAAVGSGATASGVTSAGAKGDADTSVNGAIANLLGSILQTQTQIEAANINARTQEAVADKYNAMSAIVAQIQSEASKYAANSSYAASKYAADRTRYGTGWQIASSILEAFGVGNPQATSGKSRSPVDELFYKLDNAVKANDGYALITKLFPGLKKAGNLFKAAPFGNGR